MVEATLIADLTVGLAASLGLLIVRSQIAPGAGLAWRFRLILGVAAAFYLFRGVEWLTASGLFRSLTMITGALIPFAALLVAEGLVRRHLPLWIKQVAAASMVTFVLLALVSPLTRSFGYLLAFLIYQLAMFALVWGILVSRERSSLTSAENAMIARVLIVVPVIVALLLTDYRLTPMDIFPATSGLAALIVAWVAVTFEARAARSERIFGAVFAVLFAAFLAAGSVALQSAVSGIAFLNAWVSIAALMMVLVVGLSSAAIRRAKRRSSLTNALEHRESLDAFLVALERNGLTEGFTILGPPDLKDYDAGLLVEAFAPTGLAQLTDLPDDPMGDTIGQSQLRQLMTRAAAREAILVSASPLHVAVGAPTGLSGGSQDLHAALGLARTIAERDAHAT